MWYFSKRSRNKLHGVHPDLILVMSRALLYSPYDFAITCGLRSKEEQKTLVALGKSGTMHSKHLTGHAVDIMAYDDRGKGTWDRDFYEAIASAVMRAAAELRIDTRWGGGFTGFYDGPHFELI